VKNEKRKEKNEKRKKKREKRKTVGAAREPQIVC
jgi:hypothetical protein